MIGVMLVKAINVALPKGAEKFSPEHSQKMVIANSTTHTGELFTPSVKVTYTFRLLPQFNHLAVEQRIPVTYAWFHGLCFNTFVVDSWLASLLGKSVPWGFQYKIS